MTYFLKFRSTFVSMVALVLLTGFATDALAGKAEIYHCVCPVDSNLGFDRQTFVDVEPTQIGGEIYGRQYAGRVPVAIVGAVREYRDRNSMEFKLVLSLFGSYEMSGLHDTSHVTRIVVYSENSMDRDASSVIRYFAGNQQSGGTFVLRGDGIMCLPPKTP